jgi:hypothetical protein
VKGAHWDNKRCACVTGGETEIDGGIIGGCVDTKLCVRGKHWDATSCRCEEDSYTDAGEEIEPDAGDVCVQTQACVKGKHWNTTDCRCEADDTSDADAGTGTCVQNQACVKGAHWDHKLCRCVNAGAGGMGGSSGGSDMCKTSRDCHGPLPQLCMRCQNGNRNGREMEACAHWKCVRDRCEVAVCE